MMVTGASAAVARALAHDLWKEKVIVGADPTRRLRSSYRGSHDG